MMLRYERANQLAGVCLDEQIPRACVDNHVLIAQDMSMAVGLNSVVSTWCGSSFTAMKSLIR